MNAYTTHFVPGASFAVLATDPAARGNFIMFLAQSSQSGWNLLQVDEANGGLHFVFVRPLNQAGPTNPPAVRSF